jgi:hypothetical protein
LRGNETAGRGASLPPNQGHDDFRRGGVLGEADRNNEEAAARISIYPLNAVPAKRIVQGLNFKVKAAAVKMPKDHRPMIRK